MCSAKIRHERSLEIQLAITAHLAGGGICAMQTLTVSHDWGDDLEAMVRWETETVSALFAGRRWRKLAEMYGRKVRRRDRTGARAGHERETWELGTIRALEVTDGAHGWHPHVHVLFFFDAELSEEELQAFGRANAELWARLARMKIGKVALQRLCPIERIRDGSEETLAKYLSKFSLEMARADLKDSRDRHRGRHPFEILDAHAAATDERLRRRELLRWHQWERGIKGRKAITWSRGLKARFHIAERSDEQLADQDVGGEALLPVSFQQYRELERRPGGAIELAEVAERGGVHAAQALLDALTTARGGRAPP